MKSRVNFLTIYRIDGVPVQDWMVELCPLPALV